MYIKIILMENLCKPQLCVWTEDKAASGFGALGKYMFMLMRNMEMTSHSISGGQGFLRIRQHVACISQSDHNILLITLCIQRQTQPKSEAEDAI